MYIDSEKLKENFAKRLNKRFGIMCKIDDVFVDLGLAIHDTPTADVIEVKYGQWVEQKSNDGFKPLYRCSVCNRVLIGYSDPSKVPFCHCGAKMN